jgi:hypothetical protein
MDVRSVFDVLGAGASVAAIVGVIIQLYLLRRDTARRAETAPAAASERPPATIPAAPVSPGSPTTGARTEVETLPTPGRRPPPPADDSGWGAFFMGAWLILVILTGLGWAVSPEDALGGSGLAPDEAVTSLWYTAAALFVNTAWAALLAWRHRPRAGTRLRNVKDRFWIYLFAVGASLVVAILLIPAIGVLQS